MKLPHACLVCRIPFWTKSGLCPACAAELFLHREPFVRQERDFVVRSLFAWRRDGFRVFRWLSANLKHQARAEPWRALALWMVQEHAPAAALAGARRPMIIPVPSRAPANHALGWARALAEWTGWPLDNEVLKAATQTGSQKKLARLERQKLVFERADDLQRKEYTNVVIVDDIVTTGATAAAAYGALGRPRNCEVWCLLDRRPCEASDALL